MGTYYCGCGNGSISCPRCSGNGENQCAKCIGTGNIDCTECAATGLHHTISFIKAKILRKEDTTVISDDKKLVALISSHLKSYNLALMFRLRCLGGEHLISKSGIKSTYQLELDVRHAIISVDRHQFSFYGFGKDVWVIDFNNIASLLLESDLVNLETHVGLGPKSREMTNLSLLATAQKFVTSKVNMELLKRIANANKENKGLSKLKTDFRGSVSQNYIERAEVAIKLVFPKLYFHRVITSIFWTTLLLTIAGNIIYYLQIYSFQSPLIDISVITIAAVVVFEYIDYINKQILIHKFPENISESISSILEINGAAKKSRIGFYLISLLSLIISIYMAAK